MKNHKIQVNKRYHVYYWTRILRTAGSGGALWVQRDFPDFWAHSHLWARTDLFLSRSFPLWHTSLQIPVFTSGPRHTYHLVVVHTWTSHITTAHTPVGRGTHVNEPCHTHGKYTNILSSAKLRVTTVLNETTAYLARCCLAHVWTSHVTHMVVLHLILRVFWWSVCYWKDKRSCDTHSCGTRGQKPTESWRKNRMLAGVCIHVCVHIYK